MKRSLQRIVAVAFCVFLVSLSFGPVVADPPGEGSGGPPGNAPGNGPATETPGGPPAASPGNGSDDGPGDGPPGNDTAETPGAAPGEGSGNAPATPPGRDRQPPSAPTANESSPPSTNRSIDLDDRGTALAHRLTALALLRNASLGPGQSGQQQRLVRRLNGTRAFVLDRNRVTSAAVFRRDIQVVAPLQQRAPNVSAHLVVSDSILAATAIDDAERVRGELRDRNISFDEAAVTENLTAARQAYERGETLRDRDATSPGAVEHYRRAWTHALRALDIMDEAVTPVVTVETREDIPCPRVTNHSVNGTIFDVRGYELATELAVNDSARPLSVRASTIPGTPVRFNASARIPAQPLNQSRVVSVTVRATDPGIDVADRDYDADDQRDLHHPQTARDVVTLDGDGLPDSYERTVTATDPFDRDSDSNRTSQSEAADGLVDGAEDFENDSLVTFTEFRVGTDPLAPDTDADRLGDAFEHQWPGLDPLAPDSDGDGTPDHLEDANGDGLRNLAELTNGSNPIGADSDADGLNDSAEVRVCGTDPTAVDTDDDALADPHEIALGTAPLVPDTDGDGVLDGAETYERSERDAATGVEIAVEGEGFPAGRLTIENVTPNRSAEARLSPVIRVENRTGFDSATIELPLAFAGAPTGDGSGNFSTAGEALTPSDVVVYKWDPVTNRGWQAVDTTVDLANGTATATVGSFSYFMAVDDERWLEMTTATLQPQWPAFEPFGDLDGWNTDGNVSLGANDTIVLRAERDQDGGGGGGGGGEPCDVNDSSVDCDTDGLDNGREAELGTDPRNPDTDGDRLDDGAEVDVHGTDPLALSSDADSLTDGEEVLDHGTDPNDEDTDGDDIWDDTEVAFGLNPLDPGVIGIVPFGVASDGGDATTETTSDLAKATRTLSVDAEPGDVELRLRYRASVSGNASVARVVVTTTGDSETVVETVTGTDGWRTAQVDLDRFAGKQITVAMAATGDATLTVDRLEVERDQDEDGIRDAFEERADSLIIPFYRIGEDGDEVFYEEALDLNKSDPDTDDDGVVDGDEIQLGDVFAGGRFDRDQLAFVFGVTDRQSHPNLKNTDGGGLADLAEFHNDTNGFALEQLHVGLGVPTVTDESGVPKPVGMFAANDDATELDRAMMNTDGWSGFFFTQPSWAPPKHLRQSNRQYLRIPATVFVKPNVGSMDLGHIIYQISLSETTGADVDIVGFRKDDTFYRRNSSFVLHERGGERLSVILSIPGSAVTSSRYFTHAGQLTLDVKISPDSRFNLGAGDQYERLSHGIAYSAHAGFQMFGVSRLLNRTKTAYSVGVDVALLAEASAAAYGRTGSLRSVARVIVYEYVKEQLPFPTSPSDLVKTATVKGMSAFAMEADEVNNELSREVGYLNPQGPAVYRTI